MTTNKPIYTSLFLFALGVTIPLTACREDLPEGTDPIGQDLVADGALDRFRWLSRRYLTPAYESQLIERLGHFAAENRSSTALSRLVLCGLPPPEGGELTVNAHVLCFRGSAVARLNFDGHSRVVPIFGTQESFEWTIDGTRVELYSFAASPEIGWVQIKLLSSTLPTPGIGLKIMQDLRRDIGPRIMTLDISEYSGKSATRDLPKLPISERILPAFGGPSSPPRARWLACDSRIGRRPECIVLGGEKEIPRSH